MNTEWKPLNAAFEKWWQEEGQYCRAGGSDYEKTFAYRAFEAALAGKSTVSVDRWKRDSELLEAIQDGCWDVRFLSSSNGDAGDYNIGIEIVAHFMEKPQERVIGEDWNENLRTALEQAMTAEAYPPARPAPTSHPIPTGATGEDEQSAFERWLERTCPSGDVESVQRQWEASSDYADFHSPAAGDALDERQDWMACDMRHRMVTDNLKLSAVEMRAREKRCRNAYTLEYMGAPMRWLADVYAEASAVFEAKLAALAAIAQQKGEA